MDNHTHPTQETSPAATTQPPKPSLALPLLALGFDLATALLIFLEEFTKFRFPFYYPWYFFVIVLLPILGLVTGIVALCRGKARIGLSGVIIAIVAVALPLIISPLIVITIKLFVAPAIFPWLPQM